MVKKTIFLDLDGVFADFNGYVKAKLGKFPNEMSNKELWGRLSKLDRVFYNLDLMPNAVDLFNYICEYADKYKYDIEFLTALPMSFKSAKQDKIDWVIENICSITPVKFGPYRRDKVKHCKPYDILIDDLEKTIIEWNSIGGIGILYTDFKQLKKDLPL